MKHTNPRRILKPTGSGPVVQQPAAQIQTPGQPDLTEAQAQVMVKQIRAGLESARKALLEFHARKGWKALGYASWKDCVATEFEVSYSHVKRQLAAANTDRELESQTTQVNEKAPIGSLSERVLREVGGLDPAEKKAVLEHARKGSSKVTAKVVKEIVQERHPELVRLALPAPTATPPPSLIPSGPIIEGSWRDRLSAAVSEGLGCTFNASEAAELASALRPITWPDVTMTY